MTKTKMAKYAISEIFREAPVGAWFTNEHIYGMIEGYYKVTYKTVQNITAGLKGFGGLRSMKEGSVLRYKRVSKKAIKEAENFTF